jgi:hypothetical protein
MAQRGAVFGVAEDVFDLGAVPVPVLHCGGVFAGGDVEVGQDKRVAIDRLSAGQLL